MSGDQNQVAEDVMAILPPLLGALDHLAFVARQFHPPTFADLMAAVGDPTEALRAERGRLDAWPPELADVRAALGGACDQAVQGFARLTESAADPEGPGAAYRALRALPLAQEMLYPLAGGLPAVSRYFLPAGKRDDAALMARLAAGHNHPERGVIHGGGEPGARGAVSLYVPEDIDDGRPRPLIVALHGGGGHGRSFLWSWLAEARGAGAILAAPTAVGRTWAIQGEDPDTPNLARIAAFIRERWPVDPDRLLLTGMSDGGTFAYVSGLEGGSPFTHLAPISAAFHPMLAQFADPDRLRGLPIHITHGALDWMFPASMAREAAQALSAAGAHVVHREIADLSHTYPREINAEILGWLG
ncbi:alpha/beta hydrolase [Phenylobacterium sp.]|uniref:alpha/beta hydrolase n=1 Tax=Phenylobacterium sp. TaxID=1871053 RepID=UPI0037C51B59